MYFYQYVQNNVHLSLSFYLAAPATTLINIKNARKHFEKLERVNEHPMVRWELRTEELRNNLSRQANTSSSQIEMVGVWNLHDENCSEDKIKH